MSAIETYNFVGASNLPLTSAPAEKNRPSPVITVKTVSGFSFNSLSAEIVSTIKLPPNAFKEPGRLNYVNKDELVIYANAAHRCDSKLSSTEKVFPHVVLARIGNCAYFDDPNLTDNVDDYVGILWLRHVGYFRLLQTKYCFFPCFI